MAGGGGGAGGRLSRGTDLHHLVESEKVCCCSDKYCTSPCNLPPFICTTATGTSKDAL